ncbi:hypothetical protein PG994_009798 [Apiospora phragmitis]|uniref:Uncharacterized protein n=1 Tax=Apiospora phragmitis TaxID=2905665 RepID=A0ABR1U746_9PEZI
MSDTSGSEELSFAARHHRMMLIEPIKKQAFTIWDIPADWPVMLRGLLEKLFCYSPPRVPDNLKRSDEEHSFRVRITEMQRLRLRKLQWKLAEHAAEIQCDGKEADGWEADLDQYVKALQDDEYMEKRSSHARDPFLITGKRLVDHHVLETVLGGRCVDPNGSPIMVRGPWEQDVEPVVAGSREFFPEA